jgi:hypothetical protein
MLPPGDGLPCRGSIGWVYDLFRPDEPYEDRGIHPSGIGIDRYRSESDFTPQERRYLRTQARLSFLNFADPNLLGLYQFDVGEYDGLPLSFNASLQHLMAPFGYAMAKSAGWVPGVVFLGESLNLRTGLEAFVF